MYSAKIYRNEIRRGKKKRIMKIEEKPQGKTIMACHIPLQWECDDRQTDIHTDTQTHRRP